jgi:hypothetical protein
MKYSKLLVIASLLILVAIVFITSCDNRSLEMPKYEITSMVANPGIIYDDNGVTFSDISVTVKDEDGFAVTGEAVTFRANKGSILYEVLTDSTGMAQTTFWDNEEIFAEDLPFTANIDAFISEESQRIQVIIQTTPPIESLILESPTSLKVAQTVELKATALNAIGSVPDGTIVVFSTDFGYFYNAEGGDLGNIVQATTNNGIAKVNLNAGTNAGEATITAQISDVIAENTVTINPGAGSQITLTATPPLIHVNIGETSEVKAEVSDSYGNWAAAGTGVTFTSSIGNITAFNTTDENGLATATFSPGVQSGLAEITAVTDSASVTTQITVVSDMIYSLEYAFSGQVDISIQGTGGNESAEITVNLYDSNGNLIDDSEDLEVYFKFITGPYGANINNLVSYPSTDSVAVQPENGQAVVSVSSGSDPGTIALKAYTFNDTLEISAVKSNIVVHSGPPNSIELAIGDVDSAEDMGGGVWQIECAALINDAWGNPVDYGTAVWFSLEDPEFPGNDPSWALVEAEAYVGNENANTDSLEGVAYTYLNYEGSHTNDTLVVWVEVSGQFATFVDSSIVIMPIQFATLDLVVTPAHLDWIIPNDNDPKETTIRVLVLDGQNNPVNGQTIYFSCPAGMPIGGSDPYIGVTGDDPNVPPIWPSGMLFKQFRFQKYECPPPPPSPNQVTYNIEVLILGTGVSDTIPITLYRYVD